MPAARRPLSGMPSRMQGAEVILRTASAMENRPSSRARTPRTKGKVPKFLGCGRPAPRGGSWVSAPASEPTMT